MADLSWKLVELGKGVESGERRVIVAEKDSFSGDDAVVISIGRDHGESDAAIRMSAEDAREYLRQILDLLGNEAAFGG